MNDNFFSIPLDSTDPKDIAALDKEIDRLIDESIKDADRLDEGKHTA